MVDRGKARILVDALVAPAEAMEDRVALDLLWPARFRWQVWPDQATGDRTYGTLDIITSAPRRRPFLASSTHGACAIRVISTFHDLAVHPTSWVHCPTRNP